MAQKVNSDKPDRKAPDARSLPGSSYPMDAFRPGGWDFGHVPAPAGAPDPAPRSNSTSSNPAK